MKLLKSLSLPIEARTLWGWKFNLERTCMTNTKKKSLRFRIRHNWSKITGYSLTMILTKDFTI
jgi:hypothetical protein